MDPNGDANSGYGNSFGGYGGATITSPYLNFDPKIISPNAHQSEWIFPDGAINRPQRGRFEMAFSQIGGSVLSGASMGGLYGAVNGFNATKMLGEASNVSWGIRRSQILNYVVKNSSNAGNACGVVAVLYSILGVGLSFVNESNEDANSLIAGATTGLIYGGLSNPRPKADATAVITKLSQAQRIRRSVVGTALGLAIAGTYVLLFNKDKYIK